MNNNKAGFANEIDEFGSDGNHSANECDRYGMCWGCDEDCPVLSRGECKNEESVKLYYNPE